MKIHFNQMSVFRLTLFILTAVISCSSSVTAQTTIYFQNPFNASGCNTKDKIQERILYEYGAVYISQGAKLPPKCRFENETEIAEFVASFKIPANKFSFGDFYLQPQAKASLEKVFLKMNNDYRNVARNKNNTVSSTNGINDDWALRTYAQTQVNWKEPFDKPILGLIKDDGNKPKMFSAAIPGSSQHHLGLAIDVDKVKCNSDCQKSLNENKWFRTVPYDTHHFTYLGFSENELPAQGLKRVECGGLLYWIPNVQNYKRYKFMEVNCK